MKKFIPFKFIFPIITFIIFLFLMSQTSQIKTDKTYYLIEEQLEMSLEAKRDHLLEKLNKYNQINQMLISISNTEKLINNPLNNSQKNFTKNQLNLIIKNNDIEIEFSDYIILDKNKEIILVSNKTLETEIYEKNINFKEILGISTKSKKTKLSNIFFSYTYKKV